MRHHLYAIACSCLLAFILVPRLARADAAHQAVTEGNTLYRQQHYREAAQQYAKAAEQRPETPEIDFNLGNAAYQQQDYAKALEHYNRALQTTDPALESQTKYNLGNVNYQQALQALANPQKAAEHLQTAMTYYRDSLEVDPQQPTARYNLELAHRLLQHLQQQQDQQQNQQNQHRDQNAQQDQQNQQQQNQQDQPDQQQAQQNQPEPNQDPREQREQQEQQEQNRQATSQDQQDPQTAQSDENTSNDPGTPPPQATTSQDLSPDEAERLLNAIRERAREADDLRQQRQRARLRDHHVDRDW
jgi:Ca-activated chloride channel family protein